MLLDKWNTIRMSFARTIENIVILHRAPSSLKYWHRLSVKILSSQIFGMQNNITDKMGVYIPRHIDRIKLHEYSNLYRFMRSWISGQLMMRLEIYGSLTKIGHWSQSSKDLNLNTWKDLVERLLENQQLVLRVQLVYKVKSWSGFDKKPSMSTLTDMSLINTCWQWLTSVRLYFIW